MGLDSQIDHNKTIRQASPLVLAEDLAKDLAKDLAEDLAEYQAEDQAEDLEEETGFPLSMRL